MKIIILTNDGKTISPHFGWAEKYVVITIEDDRIISREIIKKNRYHFEPVVDCQIILTCGISQGAYNLLEQVGIKPILTEIREIDAAVQALIDENILGHTVRLPEKGDHNEKV